VRLRTRYKRLTFWNKFAFWGALASILAFVLAIVALWSGYTTTNLVNQLLRSQTPLSGMLEPANQPDPIHECGSIPPDALKLFIGDHVYWFTKGVQLRALIIGGKPIVTISRNAEGLEIAAKIFSPDGRIVAEIIRNLFHVNPNNYFHIERPSPSELVVYDQHAFPALWVQFLNKSSVRLRGRFLVPGFAPVIITADTVKVGKTSLNKVCFKNVAKALAID